jgi:hypothetical protein
VQASTACATGAKRILQLSSVNCIATRMFAKSKATEMITPANISTEPLIYPNPGNGDFTITFKTGIKTNLAKIQLLGMYGNIIKELTVPVSETGTIIAHISARGIDPGIYHVRYIVGKETGVVKLVIIR